MGIFFSGLRGRKSSPKHGIPKLRRSVAQRRMPKAKDALSQEVLPARRSFLVHRSFNEGGSEGGPPEPTNKKHPLSGVFV